MKIFLDDEYKCHISNDGTMHEIEIDFFDGKCAAYVEGYRFIPNGERWVQPNGVIIRGEAALPWRDYSQLAAAQSGYDEADVKATAELADLIEQLYEEDLEMFDA